MIIYVHQFIAFAKKQRHKDVSTQHEFEQKWIPAKFMNARYNPPFH